MSTLTEIEEAAKALPLEEKETLLAWLSRHLTQSRLETGPRQHSVLDITPVSVGEILRPLDGDDDVLGEMLEE